MVTATAKTLLAHLEPRSAAIEVEIGVRVVEHNAAVVERQRIGVAILQRRLVALPQELACRHSRSHPARRQTVCRASRQAMADEALPPESYSGPLTNLDPPLPGVVKSFASSTLGVLEKYGWFMLLGALLLYVLLRALQYWLRSRGAVHGQRAAELDKARRRQRELLQQKWDAEARAVYEREAAEKADAKHEQQRVLQRYDNRSRPFDSGTSSALPNYRPSPSARYRGVMRDSGPRGG